MHHRGCVADNELDEMAGRPEKEYKTMRITRRFTQAGTDVFSTIKWTKRSSRINNADGSVVFEMNDAEVPESWSQLATDIMVSKYFRKAGVPTYKADGTIDTDAPTGPERSAKQVIGRLASCWRNWGERHGYFDSSADADAFQDEISWMMVTQATAPNSPQWFNTGLHDAYGITGPAQGHWIADPTTGECRLAPDAYSHPQPHACFIQSVDDDLVGEGGIMDLWTREARLFKYGSGTGTNFSNIRGSDEPLSGGGRSSGLMSFLKIGDRAAGAIKSGGTTRRAAKMVCLDADHPDIEAFVNWKVREEIKVAALVEGLKCLGDEHKALAEKLGLTLDYDFNGEAYYTVSGQNSNNSIRLSNEFFQAVESGGDWTLTNRTDGSVAKCIPAKELWDQICFAAWRCADPGLQYDGTINEWHTCPAEGRINASNPCSEYMFLDDTACNLASINLMKFYDRESGRFDVDGFEHATRLWTIVLEISVLMAAFPSEAIAIRSWKYRTLGLGFANLGAMLMQMGIPYDSEAGRAICATITAILTGRSYATSAEMARELGAFAGYAENKENMLRVIRNHRRAAHGVERTSDEYEGLTISPVPVDHGLFEVGGVPIADASRLQDRAVAAWDDAYALGEKFGYRNAQVSVIAPTGTIGLLMDCDTTGVEPDFALVKFKKLAGGGYFKIANASLEPALQSLGYEESQISDILSYVLGSQNLDAEITGRNCTFREFLSEAGYTESDLQTLTDSLPSQFELPFAFNAYSMPASVLTRAGIDAAEAQADFGFDGLKALGLKPNEIRDLSDIICGTQTIEGAPHLSEEHLAVFDCANTCGRIGTRFIAAEGHIRMMAASQPFLSGAISKTINLPNSATIEEVAASYTMSWELGLKANALYRDGCKLSQPLNSSSDAAEEEEGEDDGLIEAIDEVSTEVSNIAQTIEGSVDAPTTTATAAVKAQVTERVVERPMRRRLPDTRRSLTHRFNVAGHEGYLTVGLYEDGQPGELFITMSKEGSTIGGLMDSLGTAISVALQYGVPVESLVKKFAHQRFEPMGMSSNPEIPFAKSLVDYIFRWMGMEFIDGFREKNAPNRTNTKSGSGTSSATNKSKAASTKISDAPAATITTTTKVAIEPKAGSNRSADTDATPASSEPAAGIQGSFDSPDPEPEPAATIAVAEPGEKTARENMNRAMRAMQQDSPPCSVCGAITVRSGTCYKCNDCGNSEGCS